MLAAPEVYKEATEHERTVKPPAYHKLVQTAPDDEEVSHYG
jgi:alpha-ketoglutarate-dependent 2,4-dichlorophenoxyacetate dioxygenase